MAHDLEIIERSCDDFGHNSAIPRTIQGKIVSTILSTILSTIIQGSSERYFGRYLDNPREDLFTILKSIRNFKIDTFELEELNVDIWFFISSVHRFFYLGCQSCIFRKSLFRLWTDSRMSKTKNRTIDQTRKNTEIHEKICSYMFTIENTTNITKKWANSSRKWVNFGEKWSKVAKMTKN